MTGNQTPFEPLGPNDPREVAGYRLQARLGAGGMGSVYLSYTPGGQPVALKVVRNEFAEDPAFRRRFEQEVRAARRVQGVYTVPVLDSNTEGAAPWLATAYVPGLSLADAVRTYGALPAETVLLLVGGVAEALQSVHAAGIIHRDLKPGNVLLGSDGPKVIDFGIARAADVTALTGTDVRVGTPSYMAPEQITGTSATPATDVFTLGIVTYYAATATHPFGEGTAHAVMYRIVQEQPDLAAAPQHLRGLILACLHKDPAARPSPAQIIDACRALAPGQTLQRGDSWLPTPVATAVTQRLTITPPPAPSPGFPSFPFTPPPAPPTAPPTPPPARSRRTTVLLSALAVIAAATLGGFVVSLTDNDENPTGQTTAGNGERTTEAEGPGSGNAESTQNDASGARTDDGTDSSSSSEVDEDIDPDAPYRETQSDVEMVLRAPLFHEDPVVADGNCLDAMLTLVDFEAMTVLTGIEDGTGEHRSHVGHMTYMFCDEKTVADDGITFAPELFVGSIDNPDASAEECYAAAHESPVPNPIPPDDIFRGETLKAGMGLCVETSEGTVTLLWIDRVETNPHNRDLPTYLATGTQWQPNE